MTSEMVSGQSSVVMQVKNRPFKTYNLRFRSLVMRGIGVTFHGSRTMSTSHWPLTNGHYEVKSIFSNENPYFSSPRETKAWKILSPDDLGIDERSVVSNYWLLAMVSGLSLTWHDINGWSHVLNGNPQCLALIEAIASHRRVGVLDCGETLCRPPTFKN